MTKPQTLPDLGITYDAVHLSGDEDDILDFEAAHENGCFLVDWRGEFEEMFEDINSRLSGAPVEAVAPEEGFSASVARGGKIASASSFDRVEVLQAIDQVLQGAEEEMRVVAESLRSDTLVVLLKPTAWWQAMEAEFPKQMGKAYVKFVDVEPG